MAKCKNCVYYDKSDGWCNLIDDSPDENIDRDCDWYVRMTNGDRIRKMTDEELAKLISDSLSFFNCEMCELGRCENEDGSTCEKQILKFLQREVEGKDGN